MKDKNHVIWGMTVSKELPACTGGQKGWWHVGNGYRGTEHICRTDLETEPAQCKVILSPYDPCPGPQHHMYGYVFFFTSITQIRAFFASSLLSFTNNKPNTSKHKSPTWLNLQGPPPYRPPTKKGTELWLCHSGWYSHFILPLC